jgi:alpha/beta superfamily hydrolase
MRQPKAEGKPRNASDATRGMSAGWREELVPCFFGDEARRLYGCHHLPAAASAGEAVLICSASAHEYERCHRATRQLAVQFARAGYFAMRFDYFGTGDSMGDYEEASFAQWRRDVAIAAAECRRRSDRARLCLAGVRLGATLAAQAAADLENVTQLVLYAPVIDGPSLLSQWRREQVAFDSKHSHAVMKTPHELLGFPLTDAFRTELSAELALPAPPQSLRRVLILAERLPDHDMQQAAAVLGSRGAAVTVEQAEGPAIWRREPLEAIVPFKVLRRIVDWVREAGA